MTAYPGSCHCGAVRVSFTSDKAPEDLRVGRCACSFCRRHGARTMGEPTGLLEFRAAPDDLVRYRFGLGITDYLLCAKCGTYVGAVMADADGTIGIVNVNSLDIRDLFEAAPPLHDYDGEDVARRRARRRKFWMKAAVLA
jgi:hypothetical protein